MINYSCHSLFPPPSSLQAIFLAQVFPGNVRHIHGSSHSSVCLQLLQADVWKSLTDRFMFINPWNTLYPHPKTISYLWVKALGGQESQVLSSTCTAKTWNYSGTLPAWPPSFPFPYINPRLHSNACFPGLLSSPRSGKTWSPGFWNKIKKVSFTELVEKLLIRKSGWQVEKPGPVSLKITAVLSFSSTDRFQIII